MVQRIAYLPIEKRAREFTSKCLIASELVRAGVTVVIGYSAAMLANFNQFPPGVVCVKGLNRVQYNTINQLPSLGHKVVAIDEEALGALDPAFMMRDCWPETQPYIDKVFCQGPVHKSAFIEFRKFTLAQTPITGNPRIDMLRPPFIDAIRENVARIRQEHGEFILINTDSGSINGTIPQLDKYLKVLVQIGWIDPNSPEDVALFEEHIEHDRNNIAAIEDFARAMKAELPDRRLILRPHPAEDPAHWERVAREVGNLTVVTNTNATEWILAADCLIQTGCTTGVEAAVMGIPTIGLVRQPEDFLHPKVRLSNWLNPIVRDPSEVVEAIRQLSSGQQETFGANREEKLRSLAPHIHIDPDEFSYQKIGRLIEAEMSADSPDQQKPVNSIQEPVESYLRGNIIGSLFKEARFSQADLERTLRWIYTTQNQTRDFAIDDLGWSMYKVRPAD
jgi:surface carbohydrate biosynthesis protein